jgi:serine/threonine-protein kinase
VSADESPSSSSLRELFEQARELQGAARADFLARHCADEALVARIERLLHADAAVGEPFAQVPVERLVRDIAGEDATVLHSPGQRVGPWELIALLGEGGSSTVFRAARDTGGVRQEAALKLLHRGVYSPEAQRQFRRERQALAQLRHSGIARLIEGGVTDTGLAYIAIELVEGEAITAFARRHALDLRARLALFLDVCRAVEAAHRALIVHRDIKPSNVLVAADGRARLLDFGIAKLLDAEDDTRTLLPAFTPAYAAPEQRDGGTITTATDVFALGVLLGELVTGERPGGGGRTSSVRVADATGPGRPPALRRALRGDLDNIVMKAIEADPERRYVSATAFADDIAAFLDGRPVAAHPPSRRYRASKFIRRHRAAIIASGAFVIALAAMLGVTLRQQHALLQESQRSAAMRAFMVTAFREAEPGSPRDGAPRITEVVAQAIARARADTSMNGGVRTELLGELGAVLREQGQVDEARDALQWNYDTALHEFGDDDALTGAAGLELLLTQAVRNELVPARALADRLLAHAHEDRPVLRARTLVASALLATKKRDFARALSEGNAALALARAQGDRELLGEALSGLASTQYGAGDLAGALASGREFLALRIAELGQRHARVATAHANLSRVYRKSGDLAAAQQHIDAALAIHRATLSPDDWRLANDHNALMALRKEQGDFPAALAEARESLRIDRLAWGDSNPYTLNDLHNVGQFSLLLDDAATAVTALREAMQGYTARYGAAHAFAAGSRANYGVALAAAGDSAAGEAELRAALKSLQDTAKPDSAEIAATLEKLALLQLDAKHAGAAMTTLDRLDATVAHLPRDEASRDGRPAALRGRALLRLGRPEAARTQLARAHEQLERSAHADPLLRVEVSLLQAQAALALGDVAAARAPADAAHGRLAALPFQPRRMRELDATVREALEAAANGRHLQPAQDGRRGMSQFRTAPRS